MKSEKKPVTKANTKKVSGKGDITVCKQVIEAPIRVVLTIGIFFDGTANNAFNTILREQYQYSLAIEDKLNFELPVFNSSYSNEFTNIYKLHQMYIQHDELSKAIKKDDDGVIHYQRKIYIEGVGTQIGKEDNTYSLATGQGDAGINSKINCAISEVQTILNNFLNENPKAIIQNIRYDVFGFSRGAAAARYFANIVADMVSDDNSRGDNNILAKKLNDIIKDNDRKKWQIGGNGYVHFLGLFDTVAGVANLSNGFDVGDANTFDVDIKIRRESAQCGLHIQAGHEYRKNFSLNDTPDFFHKIIMPGAHSDIGGGYANHDIEEKIYITKIYYKNAVSFLDKENARNNLENLLQKELTRFRRDPDLRYLFVELSRKNFYIWNKRASHKNDKLNFYGVLRIVRQVKFGLDRIALKMMYNEAVNQSSLFKEFDDNIDNVIPTELKLVADKILLAAKSYQSYQLNEREKFLILGQYTHCSSEYEHFFYLKDAEIDVVHRLTRKLLKIKWQVLVEEEHSGNLLIKVHAPNINAEGNWQRQIYSN